MNLTCFYLQLSSPVISPQDYNTHLSKVRSFLAQPTSNVSNSSHFEANVKSCEQALQSAKQCIHAMQGLAEIEGDPFKAEEAKRKLEMQDSEHLLRETQALCAESEQIGAATLETMGRQREQIERSSNLIQQSLENTEQARRIMKEMASRALRNKMVLYCMIALLLIGNAMAIHHLWTKK